MLFRSLAKEGVRVSFIGERHRFSAKIQKGFERLEARTRAHSHFHLVIALSYGGRAEIIQAAERLFRSRRPVTEKNFEQFLWTNHIPDPDLVIRTGGELRTSNFLPWQSVYSEWVFTGTLWPAFSRREFKAIINEFSRRERRHGR